MKSFWLSTRIFVAGIFFFVSTASAQDNAALAALARYDQAVAESDAASLRDAAIILLANPEDLSGLLTEIELSELYGDLTRQLSRNEELSLAQSASELALGLAENHLAALETSGASALELNEAEFILFNRLSQLAALYRRHGQETGRAVALERRAGFIARRFEVAGQGGETLTPLGGEEDDASFETVEVFFGTNRAQIGEGPRDTHSNDRGPLAFGRMEITVPRDRAPGSIPRPGAFDIQGPRNGVHIVISNTHRFGSDGFDGALSQALDNDAGSARSPAMFVFVHGHAVSFDKAARQTAQLAVDLDLRAGATFYSWPNGESVGAYQVSQNNVGLSARHFTRFLQTVLAEAGESEVHIIAHSMGNRLLLEALEQLSYQADGSGEPIFGQLIWASPDVDAEYFATVINDVSPLAAGMTAYTSSQDRALQLSQALGGNHPRAGQSVPLPQIAEVITAVDTSSVSTGIGHFDFTHGAVNDLRAVVWLSLPPEGRCILDRQDIDTERQFWRTVDDRPECDEDAFRRAISAARMYGAAAPERVSALIRQLETTGADPAVLEDWRQAESVLARIPSP
ncbi:alpha/beta hydrolase [Maricaulis sp.]|uniref:alpha/beta hydrolase n=1 Tax=Maricaulis sp. TaxID=1486257 RepID=UPI002622F9A6|nr:alpha/beta hydrolase [Maricaulis sp.]MDF1768591.1 alpha/beta hydrolase [Maricaulis sp.]